MGELQATVEFSIELYKFYNVDLFQRGYYQVRTYLRLLPRLTSKIEVCLPISNGEQSIKSSSQLVFPACVVNGTAVSKTFQILYRNEEVALNDVILFKAHLIVDSKKIEESIQKADFQLFVELWFTEQTFGPDQHNSIQCVSSRALKLHLCPLKGLHHHLPVLFDYFHLSSVSVTVHGSLLAIHQPYVNLSRPGKAAWLTSSPKVGNRFHSSTSLESVLFGNTVLKPSPSLTRLSQARCIHRSICTLLLSSYESLQAKLLEYMKLLPPWQQLDIEVTDCYSKLEKLREITKDRCKMHSKVCKPKVYHPFPHMDVRALEAEDELLAVVNSDIAQLCAENIILWQQFLEAFTLKDRIQQHLAREHHLQRVKRFAEGFFVIENSRQSIFHCAEQSYQTYLTISDSIRKTKYFAMLPSLGVECIEMDGSYETLPVIFEDHYQDLAKHKNSYCRNNNKSKGPVVSVNDINLMIESEEVAKLHKKGALSDTEARTSKVAISKSSSRRQREGPKKEKNVGCFGGITPKSSVSSEELRHTSGKGSLKGSSSVDRSMKAIQHTELMADRCRPQPKNSFSVEELARIKEDYKMRVLESKLYKVVPDMPPPANKIQNPMSQAYKQELFRGRNSKSLSAVEEFRGHVKLQSTRATAIPRLETVPVLAPIWRMEPRRPPRLEELRNQKSKLDVSILKLDIPKLTQLPSARLQREDVPHTTVSYPKSTPIEGTVEQTREKSEEKGKECLQSSVGTASSAVKLPSVEKTNSAASAQHTAVGTLSEPRMEDRESKPKPSEEKIKPLCDGNDNDIHKKEVETSQQKEVSSASHDYQKASVTITVGDPSEDEKDSSTECKTEFKDLRTKLKDMKLELTSTNDISQRTGGRNPKKMNSKFRRKLGGFQFLQTMKTHSPAASTSSDSVVLMGYKKLEQSESLPVELSSVGCMTAITKKRIIISADGGESTEMTSTQKKKLKSHHHSHLASSMPNMSVLGMGVETGDDKSLIASESMPDLGGDSATHDDYSITSVQNSKGSRNCEWSSSDSFIMAPRATAEESEDDVDDDSPSEVCADNVSGQSRQTKCSGEASAADHHLVELPGGKQVEASSPNDYNKNDEKCHGGLPGGSTKIASTTMMDLVDLKKLCNTSPGSSSTSESYRMRPYRSPSPSSSSTSERSGWVSSQLSSSDSSSSEGTKGSTNSSPLHLEKAQHSHSDFSSLPTKSSTGGDEDGTLLSSTEDDKHIYEEIHLPPEEFRDPPSLLLNSVTKSEFRNHPRTTSSSNPTGNTPSLPQEHRFKQHGHHHHHHHVANYSSNVCDSTQTTFSTRHYSHRQVAQGPVSSQNHQRLASSSSRETGYSSDRPTSKEDTRSEMPGVHRSRLRSSNPLNVSRCHQDRERSKTCRTKRRQNITATYLETKCTIFEMFSDTTFRGYVGSDGRRWVPASDSLNDAEDDEDDEVVKVPAPPPPPALRTRIPETKTSDCDSRAKSNSTKQIAGEHEDKEPNNTLVSMVGHNTVKDVPDVTDHLCCSFVKAKEEFKKHLNLQAFLYSDCPMLASTIPYFHVSEDFRLASNEGLHLVICVHGLDGNSADLRLVKTYLELGLPCSNLEFLMSERNQGDTFSDFEKMTDKLVAEIIYHIEVYRIAPSKISFIGHSLGNIIIRSALVRPQMKPLLGKLHTFLSLSGPHLGTLYNSSGLVNMGLWFMQKWKKSGSLLQLSMKDATDIRRTFLYRLSQKPGLEHFRNILLFGSSQDRYVPIHSARIELCKAATKDTSIQGAAYRDMVHGLLQPVARDPSITFIRYDVHHALPNTANSLIGRAAHIAVLDSELFIEKFLTVCGLKYFK